MSNAINILKKHKVAILVIILLFAAKFLGFIKNIFMAQYYGTTIISDAYQMATSIPMVVLGIILYSYQALFLLQVHTDSHQQSHERIRFF